VTQKKGKEKETKRDSVRRSPGDWFWKSSYLCDGQKKETNEEEVGISEDSLGECQSSAGGAH